MHLDTVYVSLSKCILAFHIAYSTAVGQVADDVKSNTQMRLLLINTVLQEVLDRDRTLSNASSKLDVIQTPLLRESDDSRSFSLRPTDTWMQETLRQLLRSQPQVATCEVRNLLMQSKRFQHFLKVHVAG